MADQPDEPMNLTLPSRSNVLKKAQDSAASTYATPFAELPTIAAPKSKAQKQREYRERIAASRTSAQAITARKSDAERQRNYRLRKATNSALVTDSLKSTTASSSRSGAKLNDFQTDTRRQLRHQKRQTTAAEPAQITVQPGTSSDQIVKAQTTWNNKWASSIMKFKSTFLDNDFGYACSVCDRLWFKNDLKPITAAQLEVISEWFIKENLRLCREEYEMVCKTCKRSLNIKTLPPLAKVNGFTYPDKPLGLPPLDSISERLISPLLPFRQVRRLYRDFFDVITVQVINVPSDGQEMVKCLPRQLNDDDVINVNIKQNLTHKSIYISRDILQSTINAWLTVLQKSVLYRLYEINVDFSRLHPTAPFLDDVRNDHCNRIETIFSENMTETEILALRQHTMMLNEEDYHNIVPGQQATPLDILYDRHAEELSFPSIYFGEPRRFKIGVSVTPYMIANSEIRRRDRRGVTPQKVLYVAMKILRLRIVDEIHNTFRNVSVTENVTRCTLDNAGCLKENIIHSLAFMKTVPKSVKYWESRKRDLFAVIRQLGKPTVFLTISANEIRWVKLLTTLLKLSKKYPGKTAKDLNTAERCTLVNDDPVTCCIYFYKLLGSLMKMLKSKHSYNPFGKYFVKDYFLRIEFEHRGNPRAHILLWLNDDPCETVSENMPKTIDLVEKLCSVARDDVPNYSIYAEQIHKHTFTCTNRGKTTCKLGIPYWPMPVSRVLVPIPQSDGRRQTLQQKAEELRTSLCEHRYASIDEFLNAHGLTFVSYLDLVRSTLCRPTLVFRRNFDELMTNTFNPYLAGEINSTIDIQFILDEYSCAEYVEEYLNKSANGMSRLRREFTIMKEMMEQHPGGDYKAHLLSIKLFNGIEMSAQEAAWYLLRQPMSQISRQVVYIPTVWPTERQCCRKRRRQMDREGIDEGSTDIWIKNIIQRYEERPASLEQVYLAEFASWYDNAKDFDDVHVDDDENSEAVPEARTSRAPKEYRRRLLGRVIRYRRYDIVETDNYKREMVLLFVQFRNEMSEIVDQNKFLQLFYDNKDTIMERRSLFEMNIKIENVAKELEAKKILQNDNKSNFQEEESRAAFFRRLLKEDNAENIEDVKQIVPRQGFPIVKILLRTTTSEHQNDSVTKTAETATKTTINVFDEEDDNHADYPVIDNDVHNAAVASELAQEGKPKKETEAEVEEENDNTEQATKSEAGDAEFEAKYDQNDAQEENGDKENDTEESAEAGNYDLNTIQEPESSIKTCIQCKIKKDCIYHLPYNNDPEEDICSEDCLKSFLSESPTQALVADSKYVVEEISPQFLTCSLCKESKVCYLNFKLNGDDTNYCSIDCLHTMMADERDKYVIKRRKIILNEINLKMKCYVCYETKNCSFSMILYGIMYSICDQVCVKALNDAENGRYVSIKKRPTPKTNTSQTNPNKIQTKTPAIIGPYKGKRQRTFIRLCTECNLILTSEEKMLTWETMEFCNEVCLGQYQNGIGARCAKCKGYVLRTSLGKHCVRIGYNIYQFCDTSCLSVFKKSLKICYYCQKDISVGLQSLRAPVGDKGQFKDFCSQICVDKFDHMSDSIPELVWTKCAVCALHKATTIELEVSQGVSQRLCSESCFAAFIFVNKLFVNQCCWCKKYFERKKEKLFTIYENSIPQCFCTKSCMIAFIRNSRHIVSCNWCKVKKYNYDMIRRVQTNGEIVLMCSLNCLNLYQESVTAVTLRRTKCDTCKCTSLAQYQLSMSDATVRNFCTYQCVTTFQGQYSKHPPLVSEETLEQSKVIPIGAPRRIYPSEKNEAKNVQRNTSPLPVILNVQSLPTPQPVLDESEPESRSLSPPPSPNHLTPPPLLPPTVYNHVIVKRLPPHEVENKATISKPIMISEAVSCLPHSRTKECQTDSNLERKILIPVPVPIYVPVPCAIWSLPFPIPLPIPLPIPTPVFIPTTRKSAEDIMKEINKIHDKMPTDPLEAEMVAGDKKMVHSDFDTDDDNG